MSKETGASEEGAAGAEGQEGSEGTEEEFDKERALATIQKQREEEKAAKERAKELENELAKYREAEEQEAEKQKKAEEKLADRDARIKELEGKIAMSAIKTDFIATAVEKGIADPELAFVAAKEQGLLGEYDPKEGTVSDHDLEALGEKYPSFRAEGTEQTGDAGTKGKRGKALTPGEQFNQSIRSRL